MTMEAKCPECGRWYDMYSMYVGPQNICPPCRAKRDAEKRETSRHSPIDIQAWREASKPEPIEWDRAPQVPPEREASK